jgi:hypothetical protein
MIHARKVDQEIKAKLIPAGFAGGFNLFQRHRKRNLVPKFSLRELRETSFYLLSEIGGSH